MPVALLSLACIRNVFPELTGSNIKLGMVFTGADKRNEFGNGPSDIDKSIGVMVFVEYVIVPKKLGFIDSKFAFVRLINIFFLSKSIMIIASTLVLAFVCDPY
jgi:hypothetical protein